MSSVLETIGPRAGAAPLAYVLSETGTVDLQSVFAHFDGTAASGSWRPALTIRAQNGTILSRTFPSDSLGAGDTADVTYAPFLGRATAGATTAGTPEVELKVFPEWGTVAVGDSALVMMVGPTLDGMVLDAIAGFVSTVSSSGAPTVQLRNVTDAVDVLSTRLTIDANEYTSYTAATPPVINSSNAQVATGDLLAVDVDVAGTGAKGLGVVLTFVSL